MLTYYSLTLCRSTPPYMVLNRCRDVVINLRQKATEGERQGRHEEKVGWDAFNPSPLKQPKSVPYALDEPVGEHVVQVRPCSDSAPSRQTQALTDATSPFIQFDCGVIRYCT